jgi:hypothetical protein
MNGSYRKGIKKCIDVTTQHKKSKIYSNNISCRSKTVFWNTNLYILEVVNKSYLLHSIFLLGQEQCRFYDGSSTLLSVETSLTSCSSCWSGCYYSDVCINYSYGSLGLTYYQNDICGKPPLHMKHKLAWRESKNRYLLTQMNVCTKVFD